jgi:nicotinate-nucleotide adenylyltransferase
MVKLATKGNRHFMVSDVEVRRMGRSYTVDTARHFLSTLRQPSSLVLLMGADLFVDLETWKEADELVRLCEIAVHTRVSEREMGSAPVAVLTRFGYIRADDHYVLPNGQTLSFVKTSVFPISATMIREKLQRGESIRYLLPADVEDYVARHSLY